MTATVLLGGRGKNSGEAVTHTGTRKDPSLWHKDRHLAYSDVAHIGVDSVLFALVNPKTPPRESYRSLHETQLGFVRPFVCAVTHCRVAHGGLA